MGQVTEDFRDRPFLYIKKLDSSVEKNKKCCYKQHIVLNDL